MRTLLTFLAAAAMTLTPILALPAESTYSSADVWDFDSLNPTHPAQTVNQIAAQEVYTVMARMVDCWNAHDLEGYLDAYWRSPALFLVEDGAVINGWQDLHGRYLRGFNNPSAMGRGTIARIQVRMLDVNTAVALEHWTIAFSGSSHTVAGIDTGTLKRVDGIWKIVAMHSSYMEL
jgi:uncharacterized protein (TIGR02246 family)